MSKDVSIFRTLVLLLIGVSTSAIFFAKKDLDNREFQALVSKVEVELPPGTPEVSQKSIDLALKAFGISVPGHVKHPRLDPFLEHRGLTTLTGWGRPMDVTIGPAAFSSWAVLGSTLAHEIEVHCRQDFAIIRLKDMVGLKGSLFAEREAYTHELKNAERFRLSASEQVGVKNTMEHHYPLHR